MERRGVLLDSRPLKLFGFAVGKGLRVGADPLDEEETQHYCSMVGTALYVGQDRTDAPYATCGEVHAQTIVQVLQRGARAQLDIPLSRNAE